MEASYKYSHFCGVNAVTGHYKFLMAQPLVLIKQSDNCSANILVIDVKHYAKILKIVTLVQNV